MRRKCPYEELFWSVFSHIRREKCSYLKFFRSLLYRILTEYGEIRSISPYSVRMRENTDQKNSEYGHFSRSASFKKNIPYSQALRISNICTETNKVTKHLAKLKEATIDDQFNCLNVQK